MAASDSSSCVRQTQFYEKLEEFYSQKPLRKPHTKQKMNAIIQEIAVAKQKK